MGKKLRTKNLRDLNEQAHRQIATNAEYDARHALNQARAAARGRVDHLDGLTVSHLYSITAAAKKLTDVLDRAFGKSPTEEVGR